MANEIIGLGILEAPKSPKRGSVTYFQQLNDGRPPAPLPELLNWPPGRIVAEGKIVIAIGSLLTPTKIEGISNRGRRASERGAFALSLSESVESPFLPRRISSTQN